MCTIYLPVSHPWADHRLSRTTKLRLNEFVCPRPLHTAARPGPSIER